MPQEEIENVKAEAKKLIEHSFIFDTMFTQSPSKIALSALVSALQKTGKGLESLNMVCRENNIDLQTQLVSLNEYDYLSNNSSASSVQKKLIQFNKKYLSTYLEDLQKGRKDHLKKLDSFGTQFEDLLSKKRNRDN